MPWQAATILIWFALEVIVNIIWVGREVRTTAGGAVASLLTHLFLAYCVLSLLP